MKHTSVGEFRKMTKEESEYLKAHPDALVCLDSSVAKQAFKEECDVNEILRRNLLS